MTEVESKEQPTPPSSPGLSPVWRILILASLVTAVGVAALVVVNAENYQRIRGEITAQQESVHKLQAASQQVDAQLIQQQLSAQNLLASLEQLRSTTNRDPVGPVLVEVDYLARLALYNAQYSGDVKVVLALLETAERRVSSLSSAQLGDVRGALVSSITALKGIKAVDVEGIMLRLNALSTTVADLPVVRQVNLTPVATKADETSTATATGAAGQPWKEKLLSSLSEIKKVVVVRHLSEPVKPLIAPEQHVNLVENIQLKLAIAQWAALHREPAIYTAAITQAKDWVAHYFSDSEMTRAMVTGLEELNKIDIKPALPDITATVSVIDQAMESHRQSVAASVPASSTGPELAPGAATTPATPSTPAGTTTPGSKNTPAPAGLPAPATPPKAKPQNSTEPEVISS